MEVSLSFRLTEKSVNQWSTEKLKEPKFLNNIKIPCSNIKNHRVSLLTWNGMMYRNCQIQVFTQILMMNCLIWELLPFSSILLYITFTLLLCFCESTKNWSKILTNRVISILTLQCGMCRLRHTENREREVALLLSFLGFVQNVRQRLKIYLCSWKVIEPESSCIPGV